MNAITSAALVLALGMASHSYPGIVHDAQFYLGALLNLQFPGVLAQDLHFTYGSQDQFTLFQYAYRWVVDRFGVEFSAMGLSVVGQCLWLASLWFLASAMTRDRRMVLLAVAIAIVNPIRYTPIGVGEPFLTPRIFTEAATMLAIGLLLRGRAWPSLGVLLGSLLLHPLIPLPGLLFWLLYKAWSDARWWLVFPAGVAAGVGLAVAQIPPFAGLLQAIDPEWLSIVRVRGNFCFEDFTGIWPWFVTIAFAGLVIAAAKRFEPQQRRVIILALAVLLTGRIINWVGTDLVPNAFVLGVQLYRMGWLFSVVGSCAVGIAIAQSANLREQAGRDIAWVAAILLSTLWLGSKIPLMLVVSGIACILLVAHWVSGNTQRVGRRIWHAAYAVCVLLMIYIYFRHITVVKDFPDDASVLRSDRISAIVFLLIFYLVLRGEIVTATYRRIVASGAVALAIIAAATFDHRSEYQKAVESRSFAQELQAIIEPGEPIYWEGDHLVPWHVLRQESYFSCQQGTGAIFSRKLALDYAARYEVFKGLGPLDFGRYSSCPVDDQYYLRQRSRADLTEVCEKSPRLRYLALWIPAHDDPGVVWRSKAAFEDLRVLNNEAKVRRFDTVHIYDCRILVKRQNQGHPALSAR